MFLCCYFELIGKFINKFSQAETLLYTADSLTLVCALC